uniref:Transmembrane protein n=1 Tax=Strongyloides venezuelensis TaxID=75913 RepID=A0A0K0EW72_STRVS
MKNLIFIFIILWIYLLAGFCVIDAQLSDARNEQSASGENGVHARHNRTIVVEGDMKNRNEIEHNKDSGSLKLNIIIIVFASVTGTVFLMGTIIFAFYYMHSQKAIAVDDSSTTTTKGTKPRRSRGFDRRNK